MKRRRPADSSLVARRVDWQALVLCASPDDLARAGTPLGLGIAQLPDNVAADDLAAGRLVELLPGCRPERMPIHRVMPPGRLVPPRLRAAVEELRDLGAKGPWRAPNIAPSTTECAAAVPTLPPDWAAHLESGVSHRIGGSHADGRPEICRGLAARALPDGGIELLLNAEVGRELLRAVLSSRRIAYVASQPDTNRTLHVKGLDAEAAAVTPAHAELFARSRDRFMARVERYGFSRETINAFWFDVGLERLTALRFTACGAWDQSPGPGAGQAIELL